MKPGGFWAHYGAMVTLLGGIAIGCIAGLVFGERILFLEPVGDLFLNLLFTVVVPLVFFAIASCIAHTEPSMHAGRLVRATIVVMTGTVLLAGMVTIVAVWIWPMHTTTLQPANTVVDTAHQGPGETITRLFTVPEFFSLWTRKSMLALIVFSIGVGLATLHSGAKGTAFRSFLDSGNEVMQRLLKLIMYLAPIGLGAYFACQAAKWGGSMLTNYARPIALISGVSIFYYFIFFSLYALIAGGKKALRLYWKNNILPSATALGTSSSIATIPANLDAALKMKIPAYIAKLVIPLGGPLHKEGSSICEVIKIYLLFSLFHPTMTGLPAILMILGISLLVSIVEGGIPNGGYIGEILTISVFVLPPAALPPIILIGTVTDPISTLVNATGDAASAMLIARWTRGRKWMEEAV